MSISKDCPSKFTTLQDSLFSHRIKWPDFTHIQHLVSEELCQVLRTSLCFCRTYKTETDDKEMHNQMRSLWRKQITILIEKIALKSPGEVQRMGNLGNSRGNPTLSKWAKEEVPKACSGRPRTEAGVWDEMSADLRKPEGETGAEGVLTPTATSHAGTGTARSPLSEALQLRPNHTEKSDSASISCSLHINKLV